jgi:hypothetical protein
MLAGREASLDGQSPLPSCAPATKHGARPKLPAAGAADLSSRPTSRCPRRIPPPPDGRRASSLNHPLAKIDGMRFTLRGLVAELAERGLKVAYRTVWNAGREAELKKPWWPANAIRPHVGRRRAQWSKYQDRIEPERLVVIDVTWTRTNMAPLLGWAPRGQRLQAKAPAGHWKTTTSLAAYAMIGSMLHAYCASYAGPYLQCADPTRKDWLRCLWKCGLER